MNERRVYTVSEINTKIKTDMDNDPVLSRVLIQGEVSNYRIYPSGHHYFTLKDAKGALRCVMFAADASRRKFTAEDGMEVVASGRITVFPRDGAYQLYATALTPLGAGELSIAFEQLKKKLFEEGLFDDKHKKPLPRFPKRVALVTSPAGAAVQDMIRILGQRWPSTEVLIVPVRVQGAEAPGEITEAIRYLNAHRLSDVMIVGRGGGSLEDLWAFNDERVARAIFASNIPVVSAVGHEPDVTISDFVADVRAATPSHAAETVAPDMLEWKAALHKREDALGAAVRHILIRRREGLSALAQRRVLKSPLYYFTDRKLSLDLLHRRLSSATETMLNRKKQSFIGLCAKLEALSPLAVLTRGYALAVRADGSVARAADELTVGEKLTLRLRRGEALCAVEKIVNSLP